MLNKKLLLLNLFLFFSCTNKDIHQEKNTTLDFKLNYEKYTLDNGLQVILQEDKSDPLVAVSVLYHVGSAREKVGKTGFAHLFEHVLFNGSEHVPEGVFDKTIYGAGGDNNGGTWTDGTVYYEVVPKNALEAVLWLESDRMGFLLNTLSQNAFVNQQMVVSNEKRQRNDNAPYGHNNYVVDKLMYPESHPYNWQVIGSLDDLKNASLEDVKQFYRDFYGPNNATLVISGDINAPETKLLIEKYFSEIKRGKDVPKIEKQHVQLSEIKKAYFEDNFAKAPQLTMAWPSAEQYSKDAYALDILGDLLSSGKKAPLFKEIVESAQLAPSAAAYNNASERTGKFLIRVRTYPDKNLNDLENSIFIALKEFEKYTFTEQDIERIIAKYETGFYNKFSSAVNKSQELATYNTFAGDPSFISKDLEEIKSVKKSDIIRVYEQYIKEKKFVSTSFVPKGKADLVVKGSVLFSVPEEKISALKEETKSEQETVSLKSATNFDRTLAPEIKGDIATPYKPIWSSELSNGIKVFGIIHDELPLVQVQIKINGGMLLDKKDKIGVANLITDVMMQGTKTKTPQELEEAIDILGSSVSMFTSKEAIILQINCLKRNFLPTMALVNEILLEPRWDLKEFELAKDQTINTIKQRDANPNTIATNIFNKLNFGDHILANNAIGTLETVSNITIEDLKNYYLENFSSDLISVLTVGSISNDLMLEALNPLKKSLGKKTANFPSNLELSMPEKAQIYFYDFPGAKQTVINIGYRGFKASDKDFYPANVMNYKFGGDFTSTINQILREEKGYTYGAGSRFTGGNYPGAFVASSSVQSNATFESLQIFIEEFKKYANGLNDEDFKFTKDALIKSNAKNYEDFASLIGLLDDIVSFNYPLDYVKKQETYVKNVSQAELKILAEKYMNPNKMYFVVVGDGATQLAKLKDLGLGEIIVVDANGKKK